MSEPRDLRHLIGDDVPEEELERLREIDALLRRVEVPPHVPESLTLAVRREATKPVRRTPLRRAAKALALAAALAVAVVAGFFGLGRIAGDDDFDAARTIGMEPTASARGAAAEIRIGTRNADGNWTMELDVRGLPALPKGAYYLLWLEKDGEYGGTCGSFNVGADGRATVVLNASYRLADYDRFVITAQHPGAAGDDEPDHLLEAEIPA